jgi:hypothetical protein
MSPDRTNPAENRSAHSTVNLTETCWEVGGASRENSRIERAENRERT